MEDAMDYPDFIAAMPTLDVPFPDDVIRTHAVRSEAGLVVFFTVLADVEVPEHSHGPQWGAIFAGEMDLTVGGVSRRCRAGDTWDIPAGTPHGAKLYAGARVMDVFAETDRYPLKG
jgi:quercetin dioxygenase-like cupin family protein